MVRCIHYWKKALPLLDLVKQKKSIPEPVDPLFKHFHSKDIKVSTLNYKNIFPWILYGYVSNSGWFSLILSKC